MRSNDQISNWVCLAPSILLIARTNFAQGGNCKREILTLVVDVLMPGAPVRFDYQSIDKENGRLYISHMNADQLIVFDTSRLQVVTNLDGFKRAHGVFVAPEIHRLYASAAGDHQVVAMDTQTLKVVGRAGPINYPDGLAYAPKQNKLFVSDEHGGVEGVIDGTSNTLIGKIPLGGGPGSTVYDPGSGHILVAVHTVNLLVVVDPRTHLVYFPLENINGHPLLRIMKPSDQK